MSVSRISSFEGDRYVLGELHDQAPQHYIAWYAIWDSNDPNPQSAPVATFPFGPEGWAQAWQYFIQFEPSPRPVQRQRFDPTGVQTFGPIANLPGPAPAPNWQRTSSDSGVEIAFEGPEKQRRLTVAFRIILAVPQMIVLGALSIALFAIAVISWFAALFTAVVPDGLADFMRSVVIYQSRIYGYLYLLTDRYPPFSFDPVPYPIYTEIYSSRLNRLAVLFRIILAYPAYLLSYLVGVGSGILLLIVWAIVLVAGKMPDMIYRVIASILRFQIRLYAYFFMLTSTYPFGLFGDKEMAPDQYRRSLVLSRGSKVLISICLAIGVIQIILPYFHQGTIVTHGPSPVWL